MPDTSFTPISAAVRTINDSEAAGLRSFLGSNLTLDQFITQNDLQRADVDRALSETGITLPTSGLGDKFTGDELQLFTDVLQSGTDLFSAGETFGFDTDTALRGLEESGLRVPLSTEGRQVFDASLDLGLTASDVSQQLGIPLGAINTALGGAGLELPGRKQTTAQQPGGGATGTNFLEGAFKGIPQAPGVKLGFLGQRGEENPNILTGPRGVTTSAAVRVNRLTGA